MKPKGRPPSLDRIASLEQKVNALHEAMQDLNTRMAVLEARPANIPTLEPYQPVFDRWPNGRP
jgi:hypothetical protein